MTTSTQFLTETQSYLDEQQSQLSTYLNSLERLSSGRDLALDLIKDKVLSNIEDISSNWTTYSDTGPSFTGYVDGYINGALDGTTADEDILQQNRRLLSTLGAIFASEPEAPAYMAKITSDELSSHLDDRAEILSRVSSTLTKVRNQIALLDSGWYGNYLINTENAKNDLDDAIGNILTARNSLYNTRSINDGEIDTARTKLISAVEYLAKEDADASLVDILHYIDQLELDIVALESIDTVVDEYVTNLKSFKTEFSANAQGSNRFFDYVREMTEAQYTEMNSVSKSMQAVMDIDYATLALTKSNEWIKKLTTIAASLQTTVVEYDASLNDDTNVNTIQLDTLISNLNESDRSLDTDIKDSINSVVGLIRRVVNIDYGQADVITEINTLTSTVNTQDSNTRRVILDCTGYQPSIIASINEYLRFLNNLNLDRARSILLSSNWGLVFRLDELNLTFSGFMSSLVTGLLSSMEDNELRNIVLSLYYKIRGYQRSKQIMALTFDTLKQKAINNIVDVRLNEILIMEAQLSTLARRI